MHYFEDTSWSLIKWGSRGPIIFNEVETMWDSKAAQQFYINVCEQLQGYENFLITLFSISFQCSKSKWRIGQYLCHTFMESFSSINQMESRPLHKKFIHWRPTVKQPKLFTHFSLYFKKCATFIINLLLNNFLREIF